MTTLGWEPHCNDLRDEILYGGGGLATNTGQGAQIGLQVIGQVHSLRAELIKAGCNPDKAPGAGEFQRVKSSGELATPETYEDGGWAGDEAGSDWGKQ